MSDGAYHGGIGKERVDCLRRDAHRLEGVSVPVVELGTRQFIEVVRKADKLCRIEDL